jgi:hypothetical protein
MIEQTEQKNDWVALMRQLGADFATRTAEHDECDSFVAENYVALKARGAFAAGVPAELGGGGASHAELCAMVKELAHYCSSTALAFSMHTHLIATLAYRTAKALRGAPENFANFQAPGGVKTPVRTLAHMGDLFDWALRMAKGGKEWTEATPLAWEQEGARFFAALKAFDFHTVAEHGGAAAQRERGGTGARADVEHAAAGR